MLPIISIDTILQKSYLNKIWFFIMDLSPLSMFKYSIKNHPLCECGNDSYTKKITFLVHNVVVQATNIIKKGDFIAKNKNYLIQASTNSTGISICSATSSGVIPLSKKRLQTTFIFSPTSIICLSGSYKRTTR